MKKLVPALLVATLTLCALFNILVFPVAAFADETGTQTVPAIDTTDEAYVFLNDFVTQFPDRSSSISGENELKAVQYLKTKFDEVASQYGLQGYNSEILPYGTSENSVDGYNLEAVITASGNASDSSERIIVGAHYDSIGEGANDNAAGVTALYLTMKKVAENVGSLPCDVVFVAFGGEEMGLVGSSSYVNNMTAMEIGNTLLMINIDSIVSGDNLYVFCENKSTDIANLFLRNGSAVRLTEKPYAVGTYPIDIYGYGYYETVQNTDHTPFRLRGIPTACFFSGTFSANIWDYAESTNKDNNTMNTVGDTLEQLVAKHGNNVVTRINGVASTVADTLLSQQFLSVAQNARSQLMDNNVLFNIMWPKIAVLGAVVVTALFAVLHYRKLQKKSIMSDGGVNNRKIFSTPDAEDIFSFDEGSDKGKDSAEDIFTFKK